MLDSFNLTRRLSWVRGNKDLFERHFFQIAQNDEHNNKNNDSDDEIDVYTINEGDQFLWKGKDWERTANRAPWGATSGAYLASGLGVEACRTVYDPEIPVNIYDLGLIYTVEINDENEVHIKMSLTAPGCPVAGEMPGWVGEAIEPLAGVKQVDVDLIWEPPWGMDMMSDEARLELGFM